jgi:hypothetical protein
VTPAKLLNN